MWLKFKNALLKRLRLKESWVIFFILGVVMMNYPFIQIFNKPFNLFEIPQLFFYFQAGWAISIFVIYLFTKAIDLPEDEHDKGERR